MSGGRKTTSTVAPNAKGGRTCQIEPAIAPKATSNTAAGNRTRSATSESESATQSRATNAEVPAETSGATSCVRHTQAGVVFEKVLPIDSCSLADLCALWNEGINLCTQFQREHLEITVAEIQHAYARGRPFSGGAPRSRRNVVNFYITLLSATQEVCSSTKQCTCWSNVYPLNRRHRDSRPISSAHTRYVAESAVRIRLQTLVRERTGSKLDSTMLVVRRCFQCDLGKS